MSLNIQDFNPYVEYYWRLNEDSTGTRQDQGPNNYSLTPALTPVNYTSSKPGTPFINAASLYDNNLQGENSYYDYTVSGAKTISLWINLNENGLYTTQNIFGMTGRNEYPLYVQPVFNNYYLFNYIKMYENNFTIYFLVSPALGLLP